MKVSHVEAKPGYQLLVTFDDGVSGMIGLGDFIGKGIFEPLKDEKLFAAVYTTGYSVAWSNELEIDAIGIYADLVSKNPEEVLSDSFVHATN